jgi:DHA2 family multidrug resistance protein-like MFS transporter
MTGAASAASPTETLGLPTPRRHWAAAGIWLALALSVLDSSVANIALPVIARDLHALPADTIRVVNAYQLAIVVSVLPLAALGEIIGYRRVYKTGVAIFTLASLICVLSHSLPMLITARALQGFGAAGIMSVNSALVRYIYPPHLLGRGVGLNSLVIALCAAIGPSIASAILAVAHWQWLFGINVPTGIFALIVGWKTLPTTPKVARRFPIVSTALNVALFFLAVTGVDALAEGKNVWLSCLAILGAILAGVALVRRSLSQEAPLIPIDLLRIKTFSLSVLCSLGAFSGQMAAFVSLPFHFETAMHRSQVETGLLMTPWPVGVACAAPLAGRLIERFPAALIGSIGSATLMTGLAAMALLPADAAAVRHRLRPLPDAEQSDPAIFGADRTRRCGQRHARHVASHRPDFRRDRRRGAVPADQPWRHDFARHRPIFRQCRGLRRSLAIPVRQASRRGKSLVVDLSKTTCTSC